MRTLAELYALYEQRRLERSTDGAAWVDLALVYDGGQVVRIAELDQASESSGPNLVAQGIDAYARYSAGVRPEVECFPLRPHIAASRDSAAKRTRVFKGWHENSKMALADYQRYRYYFGYGMGPAAIRPDPRQHGVPRWEVRNPMGVLPGPRDLPYTPEVPDCFVVTQRSVAWVREQYGVDFGPKVPRDALLEVVEYGDAEQSAVFCVGVTGPQTPSRPTGSLGGFGSGTYGGYWSERGTHVERLGPANSGRWLVSLSSTPNHAGTCLFSVPGVISLSKVSGFVLGILARYRLHARLVALTTEGIAEGIRPNEWIELDPNSGGQGVVREADGLRGVRGVIEGGKITVPQINPGYQTFQLLNLLEAWSRSETGVMAEIGGEAGTGVRTRARGDAIAGMVIDPRVQEAHEVMQAALEHENRLAVAWARAYGGSRPMSVYVPGRRSAGVETYVASDLFETDQTQVRYPVAGVNTQGLIIGAGQSVGTGMLSLHSARRLNPLVEDAHQEGVDIRTEAIEQMLNAQLATLLESSPMEAALAARLTREGKLVEDVIEAVQKAAQTRQASAGEPGAPDGTALPGSPEAQAGLGLPGVADEPVPVVPEPPPSLRNLASLMTASRRPAMTVPAERAG